jgi:drug/metabolite transporter (DMT)-like permease
MDAVALAYAGLMLSTLGWASGFIAGKLALAEMTPLSVAACRYAVAAAILLPFAIRQRPRAGVGPARGPLALMILAGGVLYPWLFLLALEHTTATNTALLVALNPVFTLLLVPLVGEPVDRRRFIGVAVALTGAAIVITRGDLAQMGTLSFQTGDLLALVAAAMWAAFNVASRSVVHRLAPSFTNCVIYSVGGATLYLLGRSEAPLTQFAAATPTAVGGIIIMALLSSVMAGQLFLVGVRTVGVSRTVVFVYLVPVLTAGLSALLLGEQLQVAQAVGGAAVLAGVYGTTRAG